MKRTIIAVLLAMSMILLLCAACGGNKTETVSVSESFEVSTPEPAAETPEPTAEPVEETAEPEAAAEPEDMAEPAEEDENTSETAQTQSGGNSSAAQSGGETTAKATPAPTATPVQDKKSIAESMIGSSASALISAIGSPNSSSYTESCLVIGGEDGFLNYDGFTVETIRRADGSELVYDVY